MRGIIPSVDRGDGQPDKQSLFPGHETDSPRLAAGSLTIQEQWVKNSLGPVRLVDNQVWSVHGRDLRIECLEGLLWVTWPDCQERIVLQGGSLRVKSKGRICLQALDDSVVGIKRLRWWSGWAGRRGNWLLPGPGRPAESVWEHHPEMYSLAAKTSWRV